MTSGSMVWRLEVPGAGRAGDGGRWGLVLGGGGVLGGAWLVGALEALERSRGLDARDASTIVGTSAGAVLAALLGSGIAVKDLRAYQLGEAAPDTVLGRLRGDADRAAGPATPPRPRLRPGNARLLARHPRRLRRMPPTAVLSGLVPSGRGTMGGVRQLVDAVAPDGQWAPRDGVWVVTLDYDAGERVIFGAPGAPAVGLTEAVLASCAIPGWFKPVVINGRRYIDGGAWSATNADILAGQGLDEVIVLAPMVSLALDSPTDWKVRMERHWRVRVTRRCLREASRVYRNGSSVTVLGPGPEDLELMGFNLMAPRRRREVLTRATETSLRAFGSSVIHLDSAVSQSTALQAAALENAALENAARSDGAGDIG